MKNIGKDIVAHRQAARREQDVIKRGKSIDRIRRAEAVGQLKEELEATQNEVKAAMTENKDPNLVTLVTVGGWLRGTEVMSGYVAGDITSEAGAKLLRQPGIVALPQREPRRAAGEDARRSDRRDKAREEARRTGEGDRLPARDAAEPGSREAAPRARRRGR